jgi:hypothetical protein
VSLVKCDSLDARPSADTLLSPPSDRYRVALSSPSKTATYPSSSTMASTGTIPANPSRTRSKPSAVVSRRSVNSSPQVRRPTRASSKPGRSSSTPSTSASRAIELPNSKRPTTSPPSETTTSSTSAGRTTLPRRLPSSPSKVEPIERPLSPPLLRLARTVDGSLPDRGTPGSRSTSSPSESSSSSTRLVSSLRRNFGSAAGTSRS